MSRQSFLVLCHECGLCVVTGFGLGNVFWVAAVVSPYRDNVATEVPLSQSRRSRQEVRVATEIG